MKKILIVLILLSSLAFAGENIWTPTTLYGRCCRSFVFDPFRSSVIFGYDDGEIYKSTTSGKTWKRVTYPVQNQNQPEIVLRISGQNPAKIFVLSPPYFFRSIDDGRTWQQVGVIRNLSSVFDMEIDSKDPKLIYVGGGISPPVIFRSKDEGKTWKQVLVGSGRETIHIEVHPNLRGVVYARDSQKMFTSTNAGETWIQNDSIPNGTLAFKIDPVTGNTLYTAAGDIFKSADKGNTWSALHTHLLYSISIAIDRNNPQTIYAAGSDDVLKSSNDGETWNTLKLAPSLNYYDPWTIAVSPHRSNLLLGWIINGSSYRSLNAGQSFDLITAGGSGQIKKIFTFKKNPAKLLTVGNALFHTTDFGKSWTATDFTLPNAKSVSVIDMQVHPADENLVLAVVSDYNGTFSGIHYLAKSVDSGYKWDLLPIIQQRIIDMAIDPVNTNTIYVAGLHRVFKTIDGGITWTVLAEKISPNQFVSIDVDPFNANRIFICTTRSRIFRSVDGGMTWNHSDQGIVAAHLFEGFHTTFNPFRPDVLFAFDDASVYKSTNGGKSWSKSDSGLSLSPMKDRVLISFSAHPAQKDVFFVTASVDNPSRPALFISKNGGNQWEPFTDSGLSKNDIIFVRQLAPSPDKNHYFLATDDGLYSMTQR
jgi:photosystem II stability/assembly factor-like uncharacterized protein